MDFFMAALFAGVLAGAFVETEGRDARGHDSVVYHLERSVFRTTT